MGNIMKPYSEHAFETAIGHHLIESGGYEKGDREDFDPERRLFPADVIAFIRNTYPKEWAYLAGIQKEKAEQTLIGERTEPRQLSELQGQARRLSGLLQGIGGGVLQGLLQAETQPD